MIRERSRDLVSQAVELHELVKAGEGSSAGVELRMIGAELEFLRTLAGRLVLEKAARQAGERVLLAELLSGPSDEGVQ